MEHNNKGAQWDDPITDNIYASAREPKFKADMVDEDIQTD